MCQNITGKYPSIVGLRCIPHFVNLITQDILKHEWAAALLNKCQAIVNFFASHTRSSALLDNFRTSSVTKFASFVKTQSYSAGNSMPSVLRNEEALRNRVLAISRTHQKVRSLSYQFSDEICIVCEDPMVFHQC